MAEHARVGTKLKQGFAVGLSAALITLTFWFLNWLNVWEAKTWDWRAGLLAKPGPATDDIRDEWAQNICQNGHHKKNGQYEYYNFIISSHFLF